MMQYADNFVLCVIGFIAVYWIAIGIHTYIFPLISDHEDNE